MEYNPPDSPYRRAADRMAAAYDLITKQRFREALDILNTAIVIAPDYPLAYALRAVVFDNLGLLGQAEADRLRERELASTDGYPVADIVNGIATITMRRVGRGGSGGLAMRKPSRSTGARIGGILTPAIFGILMLVGVIAAGAGGVMLAIDSIDDGGTTVLAPTDSSSPTAAGATGTPAPTEPPTPEPSVDVTGSPFSLSSVTNAWESAGLSVTVNGPSEEFTGFENTATDVSTSGGEFSVFVYEDASSTGVDWNIAGTSSPEPTAGRSFPPSQSVWFNRNIIVVVWSSSGGAEFDAFVDMTP